MIANSKYLSVPVNFWAQIKLVSLTLGYSYGDKANIYNIEQIANCLKSHGLSTDHVITCTGNVTAEGELMVKYFEYRANALEIIRPNLMDRAAAKVEFEKLTNSFKHLVLIPNNKQTGDKKHPAYLTGIINILTERTLGHIEFDYNPRKVVVITKDQRAIKTLTRRVDGVYPSIVNPYALWEIKEYYGTKTFGSRVADGVYETMLDGYELKGLKEKGVDIKHYLIIDDYFTWWECGKSYLCRIIDLLNEGFVDEVLFGREVVTRWPEIVASWPQITTSTTIDREHLLRS